MATQPLSVVFLVGADSPSVRMSIEAVCRIAGIQPRGILLDTEEPSLAKRLRNLRWNVRREGLGYIPQRIAEGVCAATQHAVDRVFPREQALSLLRKAFPDRCFSLTDLAKKYGMPLIPAGNLNGAAAREALAGADADLGIVLGTRVLKRSTFGIPRLGSINLHKGAVPHYRGMPPGFWEIYNGEKTAGVTVHFVDDTLDTGDIVATSEVEILSLDTPDSLLAKLHIEGVGTLADAVYAIQSDTANPIAQDRIAQDHTSGKLNSKPTHAHIAELRRRLPHWPAPSILSTTLRNLIVLGTYYTGVYSFVKWFHQRRRSRGAVVLYHRVNDVSADPLTTSLECFAAHMCLISRWYKPIATSDLVRRVRNNEPVPPTSVAVHFDDCYRDVYLNAFPILRTSGVYGAAFVNSGFVATSRVLAHDLAKSPFRFENFMPDDLRAMAAADFEIGAHTVNHVDLGSCPAEEAKVEITESVKDLERMTGRVVTLFSYPFGRETNIRPEFRRIVAAAGCDCMFSAFGGVVNSGTDAYDIPRFGASSGHTPLYLALQIEGIAPDGLRKKLGKLRLRWSGPR